MIFNSFVTQIGMLILGVGIVFTYVQPTFAKIGTMQSTIAQYQEEQRKVNEVNGQLARLVDEVNLITASDMRALMTYMPDEVDHVAVSRDIFTMAEIAEVYLEDITYDGLLLDIQTSEEVVEELMPTQHAFSTTISGTYEQIKSFLQLLEQNNYPLEIKDLTMMSTETGIIETTLLIITYSYTTTI